MLGKCYLIREYKHTRLRQLEPIFYVGQNLKIGAYYYVLDMFGNKLYDYKLINGDVLKPDSYLLHVLHYIKKRARAEVIETESGKIITGKEFLEFINTAKFLLPNQVDASGRPIL